MKHLLVGINAKFIHSCLAVRSLAAYAKEQYGLDVLVREFTVNQREEEILPAIIKEEPDFLGFSCYIWNIGLVEKLCSSIKKLLPRCKILLGGPEVSYCAAEALQRTGTDFVLSGEGEESFSRLLLCLEQNGDLSSLPGLTYRRNGEIDTNGGLLLPEMEKLPFVYRDLSPFENRIIYYEAQRGCPFGCSYCLSSVEHGVRFRPIEQVKEHLSLFLEKQVHQVKFVDRTFNANKHFAREVWQYLAHHDNGVTNFHFELEGALLTAEDIEFLSTVRPGLFQFEIGVQSTNPRTLAAVNRADDFATVSEKVRPLIRKGNVHVHLDLIAGLPFEGYESFKKSFNDVYSLRPHQLQLGFLKLLKGSGLREKAEEFGIIARDYAPYEVLYTKDLPYNDVFRLHEIEALNELYYNSRRFCRTLEHLAGDDLFGFFEELWEFIGDDGWFDRPHTVFSQYELLFAYAAALGKESERFRQLMRFDYTCHEKPKKTPPFFGAEPKDESFTRFRDEFYRLGGYREFLGDIDRREAERVSELKLFPFDPVSHEETLTAVFFDYRRSDIEGNAEFRAISMEK